MFLDMYFCEFLQKFPAHIKVNLF